VISFELILSPGNPPELFLNLNKSFVLFILLSSSSFAKYLGTKKLIVFLLLSPESQDDNVFLKVTQLISSIKSKVVYVPEPNCLPSLVVCVPVI